jgi:16S rRNA (guanine1207-N2)-methyltransferase
VLDFACGSGVIGLSLLCLNPEIELTMLDTSALAIESTRRSLLRNDRQATVVASDGLSELNGKYDWIISNPPFHRGIENELGIARNFFGDAGQFLQKTGKLLLVCNHHLPYPAWLKAFFSKVEIVKASRGFKVIMASGIRR